VHKAEAYEVSGTLAINLWCDGHVVLSENDVLGLRDPFFEKRWRDGALVDIEEGYVVVGGLMKKDDEFDEVGVRLLPEGLLSTSEKVVQERGDVVSDGVGVKVIMERVVAVLGIKTDFDGYSFDPSGNMLNDGNNTLVYDAENCLISSTNSFNGTSTYTCDARGVRVKKVLQDGTRTWYVFAGGKDIAEYDNGPFPSLPSREYIYAGSQLVATIQGTNITYHQSDHLSVRVTTDASGNKIGEQGHYPYGETWYTSNTTSKFIFTSYERDSESGNDYAMARYYINRFGRFSCADPLLGRPSDPQSWNRYAYARNDPVNITDPSGQSWLAWLFKAILMVLAIILKIPALAMIQIPGAGGIPLGTPPIVDNGTLSGTAATLNSIYHPIDPSKFGSPPFLDPASAPRSSPCSNTASDDSRPVLVVGRSIGGSNGNLSPELHTGLVFDVGSNSQPDHYIAQGGPAGGGLTGAVSQAPNGWWQTFRMAKGANWARFRPSRHRRFCRSLVEVRFLLGVPIAHSSAPKRCWRRDIHLGLPRRHLGPSVFRVPRAWPRTHRKCI
jgi:RHS repeat-associated protein